RFCRTTLFRKGHEMTRLHTNRRGFLKTAGVVMAGTGLAGLAGPAPAADAQSKGAPHAAELGWRLGCQAWSFNEVSFYEAIDRTASLGLHFIEAFPNQKLSPSKPEVRFNEAL